MGGGAKGQLLPGRSTRQPFFYSRIRGRYDAATTTADNHRHWAAADGISAIAANSPDVRRTLRNRSRYEVANNSYARGITLTLANDVVGTGPRLQMLTADPVANRFVEQEFFAWTEAVGLAEKLRTTRLARVADGEAFGLLTSNGRVESPVQLDLRLIEADQIASPTLNLDRPRYIDGIQFDADGNAIGYDVLRDHPGDVNFYADEAHDTVPAAAVLHYFRCLGIKKVSRAFARLKSRGRRRDAGRFSTEVMLTGERRLGVLDRFWQMRAAGNDRLSQVPSQIRAIRDEAASGGASVGAEHAAETLGGLERRVRIGRSLEWNDQPVFQSLMIPFSVVMDEVLSHRVAE